MPRVKRANIAIKKRRKLMKGVKGFRGARSRRVNCATEALMHSMAYATRDRRAKKRDLRRLWIARINAGARENGLSYSRFICGLKAAGIEVNRKILSDLASSDAATFAQFADTAKKGLEKA
jgi:large subunit ribosomal protein L20